MHNKRCRSAPLLRMIASCVVCICSSTPRALADDSQYSAEVIRQRISAIIDTAVKRAHITTPDGIQVTMRPLMRDEDYEEVKRFGDRAVPVLSEYLTSEDILEQEDAVRLLAHLKGDSALDALEKFAESAGSPFIRATALRNLAPQLPLDKIEPMLIKISKSDPDPRVRKLALDLLENCRHPG